MIDEYCTAMGWDRRTAMPSQAKLEELGLDRLVADYGGCHREHEQAQCPWPEGRCRLPRLPRGDRHRTAVRRRRQLRTGIAAGAASGSRWSQSRQPFRHPSHGGMGQHDRGPSHRPDEAPLAALGRERGQADLRRRGHGRPAGWPGQPRAAHDGREQPRRDQRPEGAPRPQSRGAFLHRGRPVRRRQLTHSGRVSHPNSWDRPEPRTLYHHPMLDPPLRRRRRRRGDERRRDRGSRPGLRHRRPAGAGGGLRLRRHQALPRLPGPRVPERRRPAGPLRRQLREPHPIPARGRRRRSLRRAGPADRSAVQRPRFRAFHRGP